MCFCSAKAVARDSLRSSLEPKGGQPQMWMMRGIFGARERVALLELPVLILAALAIRLTASSSWFFCFITFWMWSTRPFTLPTSCLVPVSSGGKLLTLALTPSICLDLPTSLSSPFSKPHHHLLHHVHGEHVARRHVEAHRKEV